MKTFKIEWVNPKTGEWEECIESHSDTPAKPGHHEAISAEEWAEDSAYSYADKGPHKVTEIKTKQ